MGKIKKNIQKILPASWLSSYHLTLAKLGAFFYGQPSEKLIIIGITGTSGKSTTAFVLHSLLEGAGQKTGSLSTIAFRIGEWFQLNDRKMTMLGRFQTQKFLGRMVKAGCRYAIIETTSQGIEQSRHRGIHYDLTLFTNLHPEHIEAHGGFENYKNAKLKLFDYLEKSPKKKLAGKEIQKIIVANGDDEHALDFLNFKVDRRIAYTLVDKTIDGVEMLKVEHAQFSREGVGFEIQGHHFQSPLRGNHNLKNVVAAITVGRAFELPWEDLQKSVALLPPVPGRLEYISEGQNWDVVIDYAFEPRAMENLYATLQPLGYKKIIQVLGGTGGGRDKSRRPILGEMAARFADIVIVTNEDPYDEDPIEIIKQVEVGVLEGGKKDGQDVFIVPDRREAIQKACSMAELGSLILITGKGSEQAIVGPGGHFTLWDDREVARQEIRKIIGSQ